MPNPIVIAVLLLGLVAQQVCGQSMVHVHITPDLESADFFQSEVRYDTLQIDELAAWNTVRNVLETYHNGAYLAAHVENASLTDSILHVSIKGGQKWNWAELEFNPSDLPFVTDAGAFAKPSVKVRPKAFALMAQKVLKNASDAGYPFAAVQLDSIETVGNALKAKFKLERNRLIRFKGINTSGDARITTEHMQSYLGIKPGALYNRSKLLEIPKRIKKLPYVTEQNQATVSFVNDEAQVNLFLKDRNASRFDFLIGVLPNNEETGKVRITGLALLDLYNPFGTGKRIKLEFKQLRPATQNLDVLFNYPYVLGQPFGADMAFSLYRRDSSFLDLNWDLGLQYLFEAGNFIRVYWNQKKSTLLSIPESSIIASRTLPANIDYSTSLFGLEYVLDQSDYLYNPRKGFVLKAKGAAGLKRINENNSVLNLNDPMDPGFDFATLYDSLDVSQFESRLNLSADYYLPLFKQQTLKLGIQGGGVINDAGLSENEKHRIGGNRLLRGFDEESVLAQMYAVGTIEYRYLLAQNSFLFGFADIGYVWGELDDKDSEVSFQGFGAGITFETTAGIFALSYALGKSGDLPIIFRNAKIHFGYVSYF